MRPSTRDIRMAHVNAAVTFSGRMSCETLIRGVIILRFSKAFAIEGVFRRYIGKDTRWRVLLRLGSVAQRSVRIAKGTVTITRSDISTSCRCRTVNSWPCVQWKTRRNWSIRRSRWHVSVDARSAIVIRSLRSANSDSMLTGTKGTERVFEYHSRDIAFAIALRLDAVFACRALLAALDPSFSTRYIMSETEAERPKRLTEASSLGPFPGF